MVKIYYGLTDPTIWSHRPYFYGFTDPTYGVSQAHNKNI